MSSSGPVGFLEQTASSRKTHLALYFFPQLSSVQEAQLEQLEAARPRRPGSRERGPVLRMARQQPPPWIHAAVLFCLLSLSGAIEIPMDRESRSILFFDSADMGPRSWRGGMVRGEFRPAFGKAGADSGYRAGFPSQEWRQAGLHLGM